ncbi:hypothetical protein SLEP1_g12162 [Rubroshorea leprosula]|nr:hypothetical protein SLEP1_g12162 [Rubroshorea leprosula]
MQEKCRTLLRVLTPCNSSCISFSSCLTSTPRVQVLHFMLGLCSLWLTSVLMVDLGNSCLCSAASCLTSAACGFALRGGPLQLVADLGSNLCLSLSARSSCSSRDFAARYCRTPKGLLGAVCRCSLPSMNGEQEAVANVHGVFTGKFFTPPNGSVMRRGRLNASALNRA